MRLHCSTILVSLAFFGCSKETPPLAAPSPAAGAPAATQTAAVATAAAPADSSPSERTAEQEARDEARAPIANALMDAFTNATPDFSPDRKKVLFASRRGKNREYFL